MRFRLSTLIILFTSFGLGASAQQLFTLKGVVFKKNTPQVVYHVSINNLTRKTTVFSDDVGTFHLETALGDTLVIKKEDFATEVLFVQSRVDLSVYLTPLIHLNEVTVKDVTRKQELNNVMDDYKRTGQYYTLNPSVWSVLNSPLSGLYSLFGKAPAQARRFRAYAKDDNERNEVSKRYNKQLVQKITNMPDSEVVDFMLAFTPSYADIKVWTDYDIIAYIKRSYEYFQNNKSALKVEKLY